MKTFKRLSRPERVQLARERFKLAPDVVGKALDSIAAELNRPKLGRIFGNKAERKQIGMLRDAAQKTLSYAESDRLPPILRMLIMQHFGSLKDIRALCDFILGHKLTPRRDDAEASERRLAAIAALYLLPAPTDTEWQELTAILLGASNGGAFRRSFRALLPSLTSQKDDQIKLLEHRVAALTVTIKKLQVEQKEKPGLK